MEFDGGTRENCYSFCENDLDVAAQNDRESDEYHIIDGFVRLQQNFF